MSHKCSSVVGVICSKYLFFTTLSNTSVVSVVNISLLPRYYTTTLTTVLV